MLCSSCDKQKNTLKTRKSRLIKSMQLYMCETCEARRMEPRYIIILAGRSGGIESIGDYLKNHRYIGEEIAAKDLI